MGKSLTGIGDGDRLIGDGDGAGEGDGFLRGGGGGDEALRRGGGGGGDFFTGGDGTGAFVEAPHLNGKESKKQQVGRRYAQVESEVQHTRPVAMQQPHW